MKTVRQGGTDAPRVWLTKMNEREDAVRVGRGYGCADGSGALIINVHSALSVFGRTAMVIRMIIARQIRAARALLDWSQQQLADKAIVSLNAVARLEKGRADPRVSTVLAIQRERVREVSFYPSIGRATLRADRALSRWGCA
jgi:DNA-binding XRE family transcriptional regulator